VREAYVLETVI